MKNQITRIDQANGPGANSSITEQTDGIYRNVEVLSSTPQTISIKNILKLIMITGGIMIVSRVIWGSAGFAVNTMLSRSTPDLEEQQDIVAANAFTGTFLRLTVAVLAVMLSFYGNKIGKLKQELDKEEDNDKKIIVKKEIGRTFRQSMLMSCVLFVPPTVFLAFSGNFLILLNEPRKVSMLTQDYFRGYIWGVLPMLLTYNQENLVIGIKKPWQALGACLAYTIANLSLAYVFIMRKNYGYASLGWASSISYGFSFISLLAYQQRKIFRDYNLYKLSCDSVPTRVELKAFFKEGGKHALQIGMDLSVNWIITILIGTRSKTNLDACQIAFQYYYLFLLPLANAVNGISYAVSQQQDNPINARKIRNTALGFGFFIPAINLMFSLLFPEAFIMPFINTNQAQAESTIEATKSLLWLANATLCIYIPRLAIGAYIRGYSGGTSKALKAGVFSNVVTLSIGSALLFFTSLEAKGFFLAKLGTEALATPWLMFKANNSRSEACLTTMGFFSKTAKGSRATEVPLLRDSDQDHAQSSSSTTVVNKQFIMATK